jgi:hypothetical protein
MKHIAFLLTAVAATLTLEACASSDPRGYQVEGLGNTANETQLVREGRDTQTYMNTTMPTPSNAENTYMGKMPEAKVHYEKMEEDIKVNDKLDYKKIERQE